MSRARRALAVAALGLALPAGLVLAVNFASAGEIGAVPAVVTIPSQQIAVPVGTTTEGTTTAGTTTDDDRDNDLPGKCKDPDHRLDPDCDPSASDRDDDSSGKGSGDDDEDDSSGRGRGRGRGGDDD